ncbi:MAG: DUF4383 domain-containing protein [Nitriliruptor sp.]|uniref:DUF4383 domain-containing protein n=1 Tax=Nitriliruptor sp. TaxID=2448056 RepID=UPI0034A03AC2
MITTQRMVGTPRPSATRTPAVRFARAAGVVYCSAGIVGFGVTGFSSMTTTRGAVLLGFEVNGIQNLLHLLVGITLVAAAGASPEAARVATMLAAAAFAVVGLFGIGVVGTDGNVLAVNTATITAHLLTAAIAGTCAVLPTDRRP